MCIVGRNRSPSISGVAGKGIVRTPVNRALAAPAVDAVVPAHHVTDNGVFSVSNGAISASVTSVLQNLPESMWPTVVPARVRNGSGLVGACWCHVGGCVCSGIQIRQGSQSLFQLGRGRGLGGIGTVTSGSFGGEEALALVIGDFEVLLELGPSLLEWGVYASRGLHRRRHPSSLRRLESCGQRRLP